MVLIFEIDADFLQKVENMMKAISLQNALTTKIKLINTRALSDECLANDDKEHESLVCRQFSGATRRVDGSAVGLYLKGTSDHRQRFLSSTNQLHFRPLSPCHSTELADTNDTGSLSPP
ncbi:hypothetical protein Bca4012_042424 [Brassica carinata]